MKSVKIGLLQQQVFHTNKSHTASAVGNKSVDVVATTALILFFEEVSNNLVSPYYEDNEVTVGTHVNVDHIAAADIGTPLIVIAKLIDQQGRRLEFELTATQNDTLIMSGQHHRMVMDKSRFEKPGLINSTEKEPIEFWFDFHSPWCYFASHRIGNIAEAFNLDIIWKPVHLANLSHAIGGRRPLEANDNFVAWYKQDQKDTAELLGLEFQPHRQYPKRPSRALRAALYAQEMGLAEPFVKTLMKGYWSQQKDISDMGWLAETAGKIGLSESGTRNSTTSNLYKERLNDNLKSAIEKNLFGLPTMVYRNKLYWGNDRMELLQSHLAKEE
jgi:2-hydroxychromene-2-carboxylate isomerase/predicted thioesterase